MNKPPREAIEDFYKATREIDALLYEAYENFNESFIHSNKEISKEALTDCMRRIEEACKIACTLHNVARIEMTGEEEPIRKGEYKLKVAKERAPEERPPIAVDVDGYNSFPSGYVFGSNGYVYEENGYIVGTHGIGKDGKPFIKYDGITYDG